MRRLQEGKRENMNKEKVKAMSIDRIGVWARRWQHGVEDPPHPNYDSELERCEEMLAQYCIEFLTSRGFFPLPVQGRPERLHLYKWVAEEEVYASGKFIDQRADHDDKMRDTHMQMDGFWFGQIVQYYDRARIAFNNAKVMHRDGDHNDARTMEMKGQQALAKAMMTAKGCVESAIRVFGPLPAPGDSTAGVHVWENGE